MISTKALATLALFLSNWSDVTIGVSIYGLWQLGLCWLPASHKMAERNLDLKKERERQKAKDREEVQKEWHSRKRYIEGKKL